MVNPTPTESDTTRGSLWCDEFLYDHSKSLWNPRINIIIYQTDIY